MISETAKQSEYIFLFRKLAFPENMYFSKNILQEPNAPLVTELFIEKKLAHLMVVLLLNVL